MNKAECPKCDGVDDVDKVNRLLVKETDPQCYICLSKLLERLGFKSKKRNPKRDQRAVGERLGGLRRNHNRR